MSEVEKKELDNNIDSSGISAGVIVIGVIVDFDTQGKPLVDFNENPSSDPLIALTTLPLTQSNVSRQVALLFNNGDLSQPVIMGLIHNPLDALLDDFEFIPVDDANTDPFPEALNVTRKPADIKRQDNNQVYVDGEKVCIEGAEEVSFKCGKASITLTKSGKVLIRGTYLLNRSTGVNRIMGGSVQVN